LFLDYVKMIRSQKLTDWLVHLQPEDLDFVHGRVDPEAWYPMKVFERLGVAIVTEVARGQLEAVRLWGRFQFDAVLRAHPTLVAAADPRETMMRFSALQRAFFDYDAIEVAEVLDESALVTVQYGMRPDAEEPACHQTLGFFERLLEAAGGRAVRGKITAVGWRPDTPARRTRVELQWEPADPSAAGG
jgi:hypothetical protein